MKHQWNKLLVSGIDLLSDATSRPEARQLLYSLKQYMASDAFKPTALLSVSGIEALTN